MLPLRFLPKIIASMRTVLVDRILPRSGSGQTYCEKEPISRQRVTQSASHTGSSWFKVAPLLRFAAALSTRMKGGLQAFRYPLGAGGILVAESHLLYLPMTRL